MHSEDNERLRRSFLALHEAAQRNVEALDGDHQFQPGIDTDMIAEGRRPDPRWCNICGEAP